MRTHVSTAVLILISSACLVALAQPSQSPPTAASSETYRHLVESYREHGPDEVAAVLAMSVEATTAAVDEALSSRARWSWEELRAAAILHSQACLTALDNGDATACDLHIGQAERLLERTVALSASQEDFVWRWYMVVPRILTDLHQKTVAQRLDAYAFKKWRTDAARVYYLRGLDYESKANREALLVSPASAAAFVQVASQARFFVPAAEAFANALKDKPDRRAAALHLGRVRMLQGQLTEANTLFRSALADIDPAVRYLAALFLGSLEERNGRFDAAETLYRDAITYIPYGQSAPLALSELLSRTGREAEARQALAARLLRMNSESLEPFWAYGPPGEATATRFDLLRIEVWK